MDIINHGTISESQWLLELFILTSRMLYFYKCRHECRGLLNLV